MNLILTMRQTVERYAVAAVYALEDLFTRHERDNRNTSDQCSWPGCRSKAATDKNYCRKHLHGSKG